MQQVPKAEPAPPLLIVLSGPSGVGKDAALNALKLMDRPWHFVVTATTRPQRPGEQDGIDYIFLETAAFLEMKEQGELLECAQVYGNWYGVPRSQVSQGLKEGKDVILKVDVQGADTVRKLATEALFIFMVPGSFDELRDRLTQRMTERPSEIDLRLSIAWSELGRVAEYDYRVVNRDDQLEQVIAEIDAIITAEKCRVHPRKVDSL
ncbi:MAG: guanylate kinase [Chloroflexota bacterium]|nr:guanylate kinase [Chloroflexota bacterium]